MTNKTYKSKFLAVMLGFTMCLALMLGVIFASGANTAHAEGTKQVTEVKISGLSDSDVPQIGKAATIPSITLNEGLLNTPSYFCWICLNTYSIMSSSDTFQSGYTYAFRYYVTKVSDYAVVLTESSNMTLEGVTTNYTVRYDGQYISFIFDTLGNDDLSLIYGERLTLSDGYVGADVTTDAMYFKGGKWPYSVDTSTIQKPAWLNRGAISYYDGKAYQIYFAGTRPATAEAAQTISFQVTDAKGTKKTFTGTTGATVENPNAVRNITVGYTLPAVGAACPTPTELKSAITLPENVALTLATFYKKDGSSHTSFSSFERWGKYYLELNLKTTDGKTFAGSSLLTASLSDDQYEYSYSFGNVTDTSLVLGITITRYGVSKTEAENYKITTESLKNAQVGVEYDEKIQFGKPSDVADSDIYIKCEETLYDMTLSSNGTFSGIPDSGVYFKWGSTKNITLNYYCKNYLMDSKTYTLVIAGYTQIREPYAITGLTYTGEEQIGVPENEGYTITGHKATIPGSYTATATLQPGYAWGFDTNYSFGDKTITWSIGNGVQAEPTLTYTRASTSANSDGTISGVTSDMEYRHNSDSAYTDCPNGTMTGLYGGYYIRYKAKTYYDASPETYIYVGVCEYHNVDVASYVAKVPATCIEEGHLGYYVCSLCGDKVVKDSSAGWIVVTDELLKIAKTQHQYGAWQSQIDPTCTKTGTRAHQDCEYCKKHFNDAGGEISDADLIIPVSDSKHTYGSYVGKVEPTCIAVGREGHCQCTECKNYFVYDTYGVYVKTTWEALEIARDTTNGHSYTHHSAVTPTCNSTGNKAYYDCSLCHKYFINKGTDVSWEDIVLAKNESNHVGYETTWTKNETYHWHKCTGCDTGISDKANHTPDRTEATETEAVKCTVCDYVITPALSHAHDLTFVAEVPATCTNTGTKEHYACSGCSKVFADKNGDTELTSLILDKDPNNHNYGALVAKLEPTCSSEGRSAYYRCSLCDKYFTENKTETTFASLTLDKVADAHSYGAWHDEVSATCSATGTKGYKDCDLCRKHFDNDGVQIADLTLAINSDAHDFGTWTCNGDNTHSRTCRRNATHKETVDCSGGTATCTAKAVCEVCNAEYGNVLGHNYGEPTYTWENDVCKAERVCANDGTHKESETVTASGTIVTPATCTEKGKRSYTATFTNTAFATQTREVEIDYAAHTFGAWKEEVAPTTDAEGVKAHKDCTVCGKHFDNDGNEIENIRIAKIGSAIVTVNGGNGAGSYKIGEEVTVKANEAPEGKEFKGWQDASGNIVSTDVEYKFTVSGEVNLTAVYADKAVDPTDPTEPTIDAEEPKGLSGGAIAGIAVGSVAVAGLGGFAIFWFAIKKKSFADLIAAIKGIFKKK